LPYEVFGFSKLKSKQLSFNHAKLLESVQLGTVERIHYKSKDGTPVEAFVTKPPQFDSSKKYPLLLWIHGGPTSQYQEDFSFEAHLFAANAYVVLRPNPRGSTGYGEDFCKAIWADWGNKDYDDVMGGVDYLIEQGFVDPEKLGVMGWSYGGMLTDHVITKTTRFKAAASGASELNYIMNYGTDHYQYEWEKEIGLPWEKPDNYLKISPYFLIHKVTTPTLIMCGEKDWNVPLINSEQMYQSLRRLGVDTMLIVYPGQYHGFDIPSYDIDRLERWLAWFGHYLQGKPNKVPERKKENSD
jgi:dipeptidyl aminopeptidase/acylaminoacyl peptidase